MNTRYWMSMTLALAAVSAGVALAKDAPSRDGVAWHGGKVRAPVELSASLTGAVDPGRDLGLRVDARATGDCDPLSLTVHGLGGVEVKGGEARSHGRLDAGQKDDRTVTVRVAPGRAGYAVVTATCGAGEARRVFVQAYPLHAKGVDPKASPDLTSKPMGTLTTGAEGQPVLLMESAK